jgi:DNA-binding MarR family transcriptional regulator
MFQRPKLIPEKLGLADGIYRRIACRGVDSLLYIHYLEWMRTSTQNATANRIVDEITRNCLLTRTRRISRIITNTYDQELRLHGVNSPQFSLLVLIARLGGATRAEIGRANYQERSTLTRNLQLVLSEGWVQEVPHEASGRGRTIVISQAGKDLLLLAAPAWRSAQAKAKALLGEEGAAAITSVADCIPPDHLAE